MRYVSLVDIRRLKVKVITSKLNAKKKCVCLLQWTNFKDQFRDKILNIMLHNFYDILTRSCKMLEV